MVRTVAEGAVGVVEQVYRLTGADRVDVKGVVEIDAQNERRVVERVGGAGVGRQRDRAVRGTLC